MSGECGGDFELARMRGSRLSCHAIRLRPGQNLTKEVVKYVKTNGLKAAFVMTCVGSVKTAAIRLASATSTDKGGNHIKEINSLHEITSLVGTICNTGQFHLHTTLGDAEGHTLSGHVMAMEIFTTAEIVLGECDDLSFSRELDEETGFDELVINKR